MNLRSQPKKGKVGNRSPGKRRSEVSLLEPCLSERCRHHRYSESGDLLSLWHTTTSCLRNSGPQRFFVRAIVDQAFDLL